MTTPTNNYPHGGASWDPDDNSPVRIPAARRPDTSTDTRPDKEPDALAEAWADVAAVTNPDKEPDSHADIRPDKEPDALADTAPDIGPDSHADIRPDKEPDTLADTAPDIGPDAGVVRVDGPAPVGPSFLERTRGGQRRPVVPGWARSQAELGEAARWIVGHYTHAAGYHAVRSPAYAVKLTARAPVGAGRVTARSLRWLSDAEGSPVRWAAVRQENAEVYLKLSRQRDARVRMRVILATATLVLGGSAAMVLAVAAPAWALYAAGGAVVAALGAAGRPADKPIFGPAVVAPKVARLTSDIVIRALSALGIAEINKAMARGGGGGITFPAPITRDGSGWRADVDLPRGVTVGDIMERRDRLASGLRRPLGCVWPAGDAEVHEGRLVLWVGDADMAKAKPAPWPLAKSGQADVFKPIPFGRDPRGRAIALTLFENNVLTGSLPGGGKTAGLRVIGLGAALDPVCELRVFELKGSGDLAALEKVAHQYGSGMDDDTMHAALSMLRELKSDLLRRSEALARVPKELRPDGKTTRALAEKRSLRLHPLVAIIDECQNLFAHPFYGKEAGALAVEIIKLGRALGVILVLATQRPDKDSLPTGVSANVSIRYCLRVMGQTENDMILGTSMYQNGIRATTLRPSDRGIGFLVGAYDEPRVVRSYYIDVPAAETIADRARALRVAAGTLAGHAAGETPEASTISAVTVLEDILAVIPACQDKAHSATITARLAELRPDIYTGWGPEQLSAALKPHGIPTRQVWAPTPEGANTNRMGIHRDHITQVVTERNRKRSTD